LWRIVPSTIAVKAAGGGARCGSASRRCGTKANDVTPSRRCCVSKSTAAASNATPVTAAFAL
jgi:hypothetical protein